jgi:hypothetical protein
MHMYFRRIFLFSLSMAGLAYIGFIATSQLAHAQIDSQLVANGWKEFTFDYQRQNTFRQITEGVIEIETNKSVSIAYLPFDTAKLDLRETSNLVFEWQHEGQVIDRDVSKKGGDDRILAIYLAFSYQPEHASLKEKLLRPLVVASQGLDAPGRLLTYLWAGEPKVGRWFENPYTGKAGYMKVIQDAKDGSNNANVWHAHKVNIVADFREKFGHMPPTPAYVAIGVDSDDTKMRAITRVRGLKFMK